MFFGWYVVAGTFVAQMFVFGFFTYSVSLIVPFVRDEFGVSMAEVMYSLSAGTFMGMILLPLAGVMLDRFPVRWIMAAGTLLFAGGLWTLAHTTSITQFILVFGVTMAAANSFAGSPASQTTISRWFSASPRRPRPSRRPRASPPPRRLPPRRRWRGRSHPRRPRPRRRPFWQDKGHGKHDRGHGK